MQTMCASPLGVHTQCFAYGIPHGVNLPFRLALHSQCIRFAYPDYWLCNMVFANVCTLYGVFVYTAPGIYTKTLGVR